LVNNREVREIGKDFYGSQGGKGDLGGLSGFTGR
jgi:hypothetical protein